MHASKAYACPIVKGNSFGIFRIPGTVIRSIKRKRFHVLQLLEAKLVLKRIYPDIAQVSGTFWQKFSPVIDHWNGVIEYFCNFAKYCQLHAK